MKNLIKETLADRFNLDNFTLFAKNFFNEINISPREIPASDTEGHIKKFTFLGEFSDAQKRNIDVLAVELTGDTRVERARGFQRNLIAKYLKDNIKDAGIVAFYSQDNPDWRLSFVKIDYKLTEKGVKVEVGTPPKRYSFLVGQTEPSHTAQKQLLPILEDHKNNPLVSEIEDAFSVEKVTKEFYEKYRRLFENLSKDLKKNRSFQIIASKENIDIDNFAKKLLGQIVFLYFLQKKGWLGVPRDKKWGEGDKFFLRTLFNKAKKEKKNFYDNYLEILFYDTLNNPRRDEVDPAYSRYFDSKIPFLNGGLFEPDYDWKNTVVYLEDDIFEDIIGTFDLYNFTVKEDEPLEKEVAVDPEMLGKVFENLLPENLRKGQGAYYTPREIVHYMCQESLINQLSTETKVDIEKIRKLITSKDSIISEMEEKPAGKVLTLWENETELLDKALSDIKVCDPACGSGAFLVGMLNEIVSARHILNPKRGEYLLKKETIQNCIYGVDIDHGAVEIAKLRLWLSLVVDYELRDIEPLPNLDYKIMCGNSLLEELIVGDESIKLFDEKLLNVSKSDKSEVLLFGGEVVEGKSGRAKNEYLENLLKEKQRELLELNSRNQLTPEKKRGLEQEIKAINKELNPKSKKSKSEDYHLDLFGEKAEKYFDLLKKLHKEYFTEYDPVKKKEKRKQIENIELEFIKSSIKEKVDEIDTQIRNLNMQKPDDRKRQAVLLKKKLEYMAIPGQIYESKTRPYFLWKLNFFEVFQEKGGFDVVIANPPYVGQKGNKKLFDEMSKNIYFEKKMDYWYFFLHKGYDISNECSVTCFITPNYWITAQGGKKIRDKIANYYKIIEYINFNENKIFEAGIHTNVFVLKKEKAQDNRIRCCIYQNVYEENVFDNREKELNFIANQSLILNKWTGFVHLLPDYALKIIDKLFLNCEKLSDNESIGVKKEGIVAGKKTTNGICNINQGLVTGKDRYIDKTKEINHGVFILNEDEINNYKFTEKERHCIKMFFKNSDIGRYYLKNKSKYYLLYVNNIGNEEIFKSYNNLYKHFLRFKSILKERSINGVLESAYKKGKWWALTTDRPNIDFSGEKILCPQRSKTNTFTYSNFEWYAASDVFYISRNKKDFSLKYILSILNSKLTYFWLYWMGKRKGELLELTLEPIQFIPIKKVDQDVQKPFIEFVNRILTITKSDDYLQNQSKQAKVKEYERQVDQMVYKLYGLTDKEIKIIEDFHESR